MKQKIRILSVAAFAGVAMTASAQLKEGFHYSAGALTTASGAAWAAHNGAGTNPLQVVATSLDHPALTNETGGAVTFTTSGEDVNRGGFSIAGTGAGETAFVSAVISLSSAQATGDYFLHFNDSSAPTSAFRGRVFARSSGPGYQLGLRYSSSDTIQWDTAMVQNFSSPVFIALKLTSVSGTGNDTASLFVAPTPGASEPAATLTATQLSTTDATHDFAAAVAVSIRQGSAVNAPAGTVDTIRVGTTWAAVSGTDASVADWSAY